MTKLNMPISPYEFLKMGEVPYTARRFSKWLQMPDSIKNLILKWCYDNASDWWCYHYDMIIFGEDADMVSLEILLQSGFFETEVVRYTAAGEVIADYLAKSNSKC